MLKIGSLFSGIGGLELGVEQTVSSRTSWQVEIDPWCRSVLQRHWPEAARHEDVREVGAHNLEPVDLLCGGFPCQDVSVAGKRAGLAGSRSGLWFEFARVISDLGPRYVVVENVNSGAALWLPVVRSHLEGLGYSVRAVKITARELGAPHIRRRVFVVGSLSPAHLEARSPSPPTWAPGPAAEGAEWEEYLRLGGPHPAAPKQADTAARLKGFGNAVVPICAGVAVGRALAGLNFEARPFTGVCYPTPTAHPYGSNTNPGSTPRRSIGSLVRLGALRAPPNGHKTLNADFIGALMGFPPGWTDVVT